ncbi:MAG: UPF0489 family protein [Candidatus Gracilibacteria bacterium]|jgi:hypothetical protein
MMYEKAFYLTGKRGNNVFSYEDRGEAPQLFIPAIVEGSLEDIREGTEVVFSDRDEYGVLQNCVGLLHFVRTSFNGIPVIVVDNHNHVFYFWHEARARGFLREGATLIHIDQHKDARDPGVPFTGASLEEVFAYTNEVLNVGNYIVPAQRGGLVGEVQFVTSEQALEDESFCARDNKILNIDLDFFAPEMNYIDFQKARRFILKHAQNASLITVATSPFFIEQKRALEILTTLLRVV